MTVLAAIGLLVLVLAMWLSGSKGAKPRSRPLPATEGGAKSGLNAGPTLRRPGQVRAPTAQAQERLVKQIAELQDQRARLIPKPNKRLESALEEFMHQWVRERLSDTPLETLDVPGIGAKGFQALRKAGVRTVADLERIRHRSIQGVGAARVQALERVLNQHRQLALARFRELPGDRIDALSGGALGDVFRQGREDDRVRERELRAIEIRIAELEARLAELRQSIAPATPAMAS